MRFVCDRNGLRQHAGAGVLGGRIGHGGIQVLRWMADNVMVEEVAVGNIKPSKGNSQEKIYGIM